MLGARNNSLFMGGETVDYNALGKMIRFLRWEKEMSEEMLAKRMSCSADFIERLEAGEEKLSLEDFCCLIDALECPADKLLNPLLLSASRLLC